VKDVYSSYIPGTSQQGTERCIQLVFLTETIFFSYKKSVVFFSRLIILAGRGLYIPGAGILLDPSPLDHARCCSKRERERREGEQKKQLRRG
jgi:hypothetical protein